MLDKFKKRLPLKSIKMTKQLTIKLLLNALVFSAIVILLIISIGGIKNLSDANKGLARMYNDIITPIDNIQKINSSFYDMRVNGYKALRLNVFKEYDKNLDVNIKKSYKDIMDIISDYEKKKCSKEELNLIAQLKKDLSDYMDMWGTYNTMMENREDVSDLFKFNAIGSKIQNSINELVSINRNIAKGIYSENQSNFKITIKREIILLILGTAILLLISIKIVNIMVVEIKEISEVINELSNANFAIKINTEGKNEFAKMKKLLNDMIIKVSLLIKNVKGSTDNLSASSQQLSATSEEMSSSSQELATILMNVSEGSRSQCKELKEVVCLMAEFSNKIEEVYEKIDIVKNQTYKAIDKTNIGNDEMDKLVKSINEIKYAFKKVIDKVNNLTVSVKEINNITKTINEISEQTNLLALNAAIEAARAGEVGKGFAVVAQEVRKLAEKSKNSTLDISNLIQSIQNDTAEVIETSTNVDELINRQINIVDNSVVVFKDILDSIEKIEPLMIDTYNKMANMDESKDNVLSKIKFVDGLINGNMSFVERVAASSEELSASSEEVSSTAQALNMMAFNLMELVEIFKVKEE